MFDTIRSTTRLRWAACFAVGALVLRQVPPRHPQHPPPGLRDPGHGGTRRASSPRRAHRRGVPRGQALHGLEQQHESTRATGRPGSAPTDHRAVRRHARSCRATATKYINIDAGWNGSNDEYGRRSGADAAGAACGRDRSCTATARRSASRFIPGISIRLRSRGTSAAPPSARPPTSSTAAAAGRLLGHRPPHRLLHPLRSGLHPDSIADMLTASGHRSSSSTA